LLVILDANVVAAAAELREESFTFRAVVGTLLPQHALLISPLLRFEYERVLAKPDLVARHRLEPSDQAGYLDALFSDAVIDVPTRAVRDCPDPEDQHLWDLLEANPDAVLVTGDHRLQESHHFPSRILSPRQFVQRYLKS
jgi:predicted nucleic acid-binding protein